jgi:hypothetical protein
MTAFISKANLFIFSVIMFWLILFHFSGLCVVTLHFHLVFIAQVHLQYRKFRMCIISSSEDLMIKNAVC